MMIMVMLVIQIGILLARTTERVGTFKNITGMLKARSSVGKMGSAVCKCAGLGDVGFDNHWVLELTAFSSQGQPYMVAGSRIAQIAFFETKSPPRRPYAGQYKVEDWPTCMVPKMWRHHIVDDVAKIGKV
jgi:dCTP deaminase